MLFSSSAQRWEILKKHVELSIKSQSDTRWESRIKCIKPLRYNLKEVLLALKDLEAISIERKDGRAASETKSLIAHLSKWSFLLSVFIWYDILFQVNKASKILQSYGVSLHTMETEIQATEKFLQNYRTTGYDSAATSAVEIAQELDIDPSFPPSRSGKKRRLFDYQGEEEQRATPELKFKSNFFYPLVDQAIMSIKERFNLLREVSSAFSFLYTRDKLLLVQQENALLTCCKEFQKKFGDIDSDEMSAELQRFVLILQKKTQSQYGSRLSELSSKAAPINSRLNVVVRSPAPFGLGRNGCWPSRGSQLPRALPIHFFAMLPPERPQKGSTQHL